MTNDELLHKWVEQTITSEELILFRQRPEYEELTRLYAGTEALQAPAFDQEDMLKEILSHDKKVDVQRATSETVSKTAPVTRRLWLRVAAAACIFLIPAYFLLLGGGMTKELSAGQSLAGVLPDMSNYVLTGPAKLTYKKGLTGNRNLTLEGKAKFVVEKGKPFIVTTPNGRVEVLGTTFEVESREITLQVSCTEGRVAVYSPDESYREELGANESMRLIDSKAAYTYKLNNTKLKNVTLKEVQEELTDRYKVEFQSGGIDLSEKLSCNFSNDNLDLALKTTLAPLGLKYSLSGNKVILTQ